MSNMAFAAATVATDLGAAHGGDLSFVALFLQAGLVVKIVMAVLALSSVWSWAIVIDKQMLFGSLRRDARRFEQAFWGGRSLDELETRLGERPRDAMSRVFAAAMREWRESRERGSTGRDALVLLGATERVDRVMNLVVAREVAKAENGIGVLASVASAAPFIGLFGTVWGIMNSFQAIAISQDTNLAVVAPGIAEALFATALGLLAAIPAAIFYNKFAADVNKYNAQLEGFADELSAILSRRIGERV